MTNKEIVKVFRDWLKKPGVRKQGSALGMYYDTVTVGYDDLVILLDKIETLEKVRVYVNQKFAPESGVANAVKAIIGDTE